MKQTTVFSYKKCKWIYMLFISVFTFNSLFAESAADPAIRAKVADFTSQSKTLGFLENKGQMRDDKGNAAPYVLFQATMPNLNLWVTTSGLTYQFIKYEKEENEVSEIQNNSQKDNKKGEWHRVDMLLKGAEIKKENIVAEDNITTGGDLNYFLAHCPNGVFNVQTFSKVTIKNIYEGIDWVLYTQNGMKGAAIKQDFIVHPNANPNQIKLIYEGSGKLEVLNNQIHFENKIGEIQEGKLFCYQGNESNEVASNYKVNKNATLLNKGPGNFYDQTIANKQPATTSFSYEIAIETGLYNKNEILVIDPQLVWCSFVGVASAFEAIMDMECNMANGDLLTAGYVGSADFPVITPSGAYTQTFATNRDGLILKFNNTGALLWSTFYGGSNYDQFNAMALDKQGNLLITGETQSTNFPTLNPGGGAYFDNVLDGSNDAVVLKFNSTGVRVWATYYGGNSTDYGMGITSDSNNNIFVTGTTKSNNLSTLNPGGGAHIQAFNPISTRDDVFIVKFNVSAVRIWATFFGGSQWDYVFAIATDINDNIFITGNTLSSDFTMLNPGGGAYYQSVRSGTIDAFVSKFNSSGVLVWSTYYGGSASDYGYSLQSDYLGNIILAGVTNGGSLPILNPGNGAYFQTIVAGGVSDDAFITKFSSTGVQLWGTYYGGTGAEGFGSNSNIVVDTCNNIFLAFNTTSTDIPTQNTPTCTSGFYDGSFNGVKDNFILKFNSAGARLWGSYLGGDGHDFREALAIDATNNLFIGGEWTDQGGVIVNSATYPVVNPGGGAYYDGTWNGGQDDIYVVKFGGLNPNLLQAQTNSGGCAGCNGTATVTANCGDPSFSYVWSNGSQTLNSASATNTITGLCPGTYSVTVTSGCNTVLTATFTIGGTFGIAPVVTANSNLTLTCTNPTGAISANATPVSSTFSWTGTGIVSGENTSSPTVNAGGTYTVIATYSGCHDTAVVTVISDKLPPPASTAGSAFQINCIYSSDSISVWSTTSGVTYSWTGPIPGIVSGSTTATPTVNAPGTYTVTVLNPSNGCTNTATVTVTQNTTTPSLTTGAPLTLNCLVVSGTISASSSATVPIYNWSGPNPGIVSGGSTATPTVNAPGTYSVTVTDNANGCTNTATVLVNQNIAIPNVTAGPGFMLSCTNTSGTISANSTTGGVTYSWSGASVVGSNATQTVTVNAPGTYTVTVTNPINKCTNSATVVVTSDNSLPNLAAGPPLTLNCVILSGTITANTTTPNTSFGWTGSGVVSVANTVGSSTATVNLPGTYIVSVTDLGTGCTSVASILVVNDVTPPAITSTTTSTLTCVTTSDTIIVFSPVGGVTYSWTGVAGGIVSGNSSSSPVISLPGTYTVVITNPNNGCTNSTTITVGQNITPPNVLAGNPVTLTCADTSKPITVSSTTTGVGYNWSGPGIISGSTTSSPIVNKPGPYNVIVTDPVNGCTSSASVIVNQNIVNPNVSAGATLTLTCAVTSSTISASSTTPGATFSWTGPNVISGSTTFSPVVGDVGTYTVVVTDTVNGCTSSATVTVNDNLIPPNVTAGPLLTLHCNLSSSSISASSTVVGATYSWSGPGIVSGDTTANPIVNAGGIYTVTVTDPLNGCTSTSTVTVVIAPLPTALVFASVTTMTIGNSTQLSAAGGGTYNWTPTTGLSCSTCQDPIASPLDTITYCVTVTDQYGCSDSACITIYVIDPCPPNQKDFPIPNVFTPNGDNRNDLFFLKEWNNECIEEFNIEIYDRWGLKMFESVGTNVHWDGRTASGLECPAGTYYYIVSFKKVRSQTKLYKGFLTLTR